MKIRGQIPKLHRGTLADFSIRSIITPGLLVLLLCACEPSEFEQLPSAKEGVLDLSETAFLDRNYLVDLKGEWQFHRDEFVDPEAVHNARGTIQVPGSWNSHTIEGERLGGSGVGSYVLRVLLPEHVVGQELGVRLPKMSTAYTMYVNGVRISGVGNPGWSMEESTPAYFVHSVSFRAESSQLNFVFHVSNFHHRTGGLLYAPVLGGRAAVIQKERKTWILDLLAFGALLITGVYHVAMFGIRRNDKISFYFGMSCLVFSLRVLSTGEYYINAAMPNISWVTVLRIEYFAGFLLVPCFMSYLCELFIEGGARWIKALSWSIAFFFTLVILLFDSDRFTLFMPYYQVLLLVWLVWGAGIIGWAARQRKPNALPTLIAFGVIIVAGVNDVLYNNTIVFTGNWAPFAVLGFIFFQSYLLSRMFAEAFNKVEDLSRELGQKVDLRSQELKSAMNRLENAQDQLVESEKLMALGQLIAGIAHEIANPLGVIRASAANNRKAFSGYIAALPGLYESLNKEELSSFFHLIRLSVSREESISTRDERRRRKRLVEELKTHGVFQVDEMASLLNELGIDSDQIPDLLSLLRIHNVNAILQIALSMSSQNRNSVYFLASVERAAKVVLALKRYGQDDAGEKMRLSSIEESIETVVTLFHNQTKHGVKVIKQGLEDLPSVPCNVDELNQVWTNLIQNAIHAMDQSGTIKIAGIEEKEHVRIEFTDDGKGIPPDLQSSVFESFFTTKVKGEGTGLGLAISKRIIEKHNGEISLQSSSGETTFSVLIPKKLEDSSVGHATG